MDEPDSRRILLVAGADAVEIDLAAGGRLASFVASGRQRLVTTPPPGVENPELRWGMFVMAPWAGRLGHARFPWHGSSVALHANYGPHAIHGLVVDRPWELVRSDEGTAEVRCDLTDGPWPFTGSSVTQRVALNAGVLTQQVHVTAGDHDMPAAAGWHPWFRRPDDGDVAVLLDAAAHLELDDDSIPTGAVRPVDGATDLREMPRLGDRRLDHVYVRPGRTALLQWPDLRLEMTFGPTVTAAVVHTPAAGVCVEPQTAWPDAVNLEARGVEDSGLVHLAPREELTVTVAWRW